MLPSSIPLIVATAAFTLLGTAFLAWGWSRGFFSDLDAQAKVIFEERDWRLERPWETPLQQLERQVAHGEPIPAENGEWGGAN